MNAPPNEQTANAPIKSNAAPLAPTNKPIAPPDVFSSKPEALDAVTEKARQLLKPCPAEGTGVHKWVCYAACTLVEAGWTDEDAESAIEELMKREPNPAKEIESALRYARGERKCSTPRWSLPNQALIAEAVKNGPTLLQVIERSPERIELYAKSRTEKYIDALFPGNPLLCVGAASDSFRSAPRETLRGAQHLYSLIVPSTMSAPWGLTKTGKRSAHCENNTGPRRYLVVEFDNGSLNRQAARLWHLARFMPLVLIAFSGSKSLHGWFVCAGRSEEKLEQFFNYACALGCDDATWKREQFVRMPDGTRRGGEEKAYEALHGAGLRCLVPRRQLVMYWNPALIK